MSMCNTIEYSDNYSKTSGGLYLFGRDEPHAFTGSESFKFKTRWIDKTNNTNIVNAEIAAPLKYLSNFWELLKWV